MNNNFHDPENQHYADDPEYRGDWWRHTGYEYPYDIYDALVAVELAREAGKFSTQADYDTAYAAAQQLESPDDLQRNLIEYQGLRALIPAALDSEHLSALQRACPEHTVLSAMTDPYEGIVFDEWTPEPSHGVSLPCAAVNDSPTESSASGLMVLSFRQDREVRPKPRWTSSHALVRALTEGRLDSAVTLPALARGEVGVALTARSIETILEHMNERGVLDTSPDSLFFGLTCTWRCLSSVTPDRPDGPVHLVQAVHSRNLWECSSLWEAEPKLLGDSIRDPRTRGLSVGAAAALHAERLVVDSAVADLELLLDATSGLRFNNEDNPFG